MSAEINIATIHAVYEAFGTGDVAAILDVCTDDVDWGTDTSAHQAPWWGIRKGKDGVASFFTDFGTAMEVTRFEPLSFAANDNDVHTVVGFEAKVRANGNTSAMNLHHWFSFRDGKIAYYRGTEDTIVTAAALAG